MQVYLIFPIFGRTKTRFNPLNCLNFDQGETDKANKRKPTTPIRTAVLNVASIFKTGLTMKFHSNSLRLFCSPRQVHFGIFQTLIFSRSNWPNSHRFLIYSAPAQLLKKYLLGKCLSSSSEAIFDGL